MKDANYGRSDMKKMIMTIMPRFPTEKLLHSAYITGDFGGTPLFRHPFSGHYLPPHLLFFGRPKYTPLSGQDPLFHIHPHLPLFARISGSTSN